MSRLLLIELNNGVPSRNERLMYLPFVKGLARELLIPCSWLRVGTSFTFVEGRNELGHFFRLFPETRLPAEDLLALLERMRSFQPSHVLVAGQAPPGFVDALHEAAPELAVAEIPPPHLPYFEAEPGAGDSEGLEDDGPCADSHAERFVGRSSWLLTWLGRGGERPREEFLVSAAAPHYGFENANAAAEKIQPFLSLVSGTPCVNRRRIAGNPVFDEIADPEAPEYGCSFCRGDQPRVSSGELSGIEVVEAQLDAFLATSPIDRSLPLEVDVYDIGNFHSVDAFFDMALGKALPAATFRFSPRVAELLAAGPRLLSVLPRLEERGWRVVLHAVGVENFSEAELHRFNKPEPPARVDRAVALLKELQRRFPETFRGSEERGSAFGQLSFILFTPWTTLCDLRQNLERGKALGFDENGAWLLKALVFHSGRPITRLAKSEEGVVVESYEDVAMELAISGMGSAYYHYDVIPWRFRDRAVADFFACFVRIAAAWAGSEMTERVLGDDEAYRFARDTIEDISREGLSLHSVAMALLTRLEANPETRLCREDVAHALGADERRKKKGATPGRDDATKETPEGDRDRPSEPESASAAPRSASEEEAPKPHDGPGSLRFAARSRSGDGGELCFHIAGREEGA
jgi:hypothetical protein